MGRRLQILLLQPAWDGLGFRRKIKVNEYQIHPLAMGVIAALSGDHEVHIIDEAREPIPASANGFDVIGISVNTFNAPRAYALGDRFRAEHIPVIMGGPHTSLMPGDCLLHADAIVLGDAEDTWPRILEDLQRNKLQARYVSCNSTQITALSPRRDLFRKTSPHAAYCQMSRGCENQCRFCYLQYMPQRTLRIRPIDSIIDELRAMPQEIILFVDDNVFCRPDYIREVLEGITPVGKRWWIQAPTNLHKNDGLIPLMARSGCYSVSIGFQTASNLNNQNERILQNRVEDYAALVQELHEHRILVDGTFIFGFDGDDPSTFDATGDLITRLGLDSYTFYFLTPYPGTPYFCQYQQAGRLLHQDWSRYDWDHVVINPLRMSAQQLRDGVAGLYRRLDRKYFLLNGVRRGIANHNHSSIRLLSFLGSLAWSYYWSPFSRE